MEWDSGVIDYPQESLQGSHVELGRTQDREGKFPMPEVRVVKGRERRGEEKSRMADERVETRLRQLKD